MQTADIFIQRARGAFPTGLYQPAGSFRFSVDALLLACFAASRLRERSGNSETPRVLDLGCGCGVAGFAALLALPDGNIALHGVDIQPELLTAAEENAARLGFTDSFSVQCADVAVLPAPETPFDLIVANPPFYDETSGRLPKNASRKTALFASPETLPAFIAAAGRSIAPEGLFSLIYPAEKFPLLRRHLEAEGFTVTVAQSVAARAGHEPFRVLVCAAKGFSGETRWLPPVALMEANGPCHTQDALLLCPFLAQSNLVSNGDAPCSGHSGQAGQAGTGG